MEFVNKLLVNFTHGCNRIIIKMYNILSIIVVNISPVKSSISVRFS